MKNETNFFFCKKGKKKKKPLNLHQTTDAQPDRKQLVNDKMLSSDVNNDLQ